MNLPNQQELLKTFSSFLIESGLSAVSIKNYLCDLRHFLTFCASLQSTDSSLRGTPWQSRPLPASSLASDAGHSRPYRESIQSNVLVSISSPNIEEIFQNITKYITFYLENQKSVFTPQSTINRRLASVRRFTTFLSVKFGIPTTLLQTQRPTSSVQDFSPISQNNYPITETHQNTSLPSASRHDRISETSSLLSPLTASKIVDQFKSYLQKDKKTHSTIKNYISDLNHFFLWTANQTPYTIQNLVNILSESQLQAYVTYLKLNRVGVSVINRRQSSIKKLAKFCALEKYIPENPFEIKQVIQSLVPLSWIERLSRKPKKSSDAPKNRLAILYSKYNALPFTPYLHIAILVLATSTMAIFGYNQIIKGASPSSAAMALTPPKRQLSFQGRLTDSGGTSITTAVNIVFKLWNAYTGPTQLYSTGTCTITPDVDGIFNTLIGDTVCGADIPASVFTDNRDVYLELTVGTETLTPRQQIATVGYALNSETLQGYPASASATANTVPVMDNEGNIVLGQLNPSIIATSSSGTFTVKGDTLSFQTNLNSGGDIILQPDALGQGQILGIGGTTDTDSFRMTNANLTTGALISGYVGNNASLGRLISLTSGSTETDRFWVMTDGRTNINATATDSALIVNQNGTGNLITASASGVTKFTVTDSGNVDITGQYLVNGSPLTASNWQRTLGSLAPLYLSDSINVGSTATASATVHLAGTANENSWINTGSFGVGLTNPSYKLDVSGDINTTGALRVSGSAGSSTQILSSTGTGLAWIDQSAVSGTNFWQRNIGVVSPTQIWESINLGNIATASATVHLAGVTGENSFINTGYFGLGLVNPSYMLDVTGDINITSGGIRAAGSFGVAGQVLSTTGTGVQWVDASTGGGGGSSNWSIANGTIYPINTTLDALIGGDSTSSAKFAFINVDSGTPTASISGTTAGANTYLTGNGNLATTQMQPLTLGGFSTGPIQLSPKGTIGLNVDSSGNVGVGTTAPTTTLDVTGTAHVSSTVKLSSLSNNRLVATDGSQNLVSTISSANLASSITDETGTQNAVFSDAPTFTTSITDPLLIGGTGVGSSLSLRSTSGAGSTDYINFQVGNNGAIEAMRIDTLGQIGMGTSSPLAKLDIRAISGTSPVASVSGATAMSTMILDQSGLGDIFTASTSGQTRFTIANSGAITTSLGTGIVHSDATGLLTSSLLSLTADVTGILPILNGGTNNSTFTSGKFIAYDGTSLSSTAFDSSSFEVPLTFSNGLTRVTNDVHWGGQLSGATNIDMNSFNVAFTGAGNFGIGAALPSQKLDVAGFFVVDTANSRVGIGTTTPAAKLEIAGSTSTISNSTGDITINAASGFLNFSGNNLNNFLNATASGQIQLGKFSTVSLPTALGTGSIIFNTTENKTQAWNGSTWANVGDNFFQRDPVGIISSLVSFDSLNIGGSASASALIRLSTNTSFNTFFKNSVAIGFNTALAYSGAAPALQVTGDIVPKTPSTDSLGRTSYAWNTLYLTTGIYDNTGGSKISIANTQLAGSVDWNVTTGLRVGDTSNSLPTGTKLYVTGDATASGSIGALGFLYVGGTSKLVGDVTVGGGTGKMDVGTIDPPYTINGEKYATYMASMIGLREEVMGKVSASELTYINGLGYRVLIDLDQQEKGSDLWLFSKTTSLKTNIGEMSVLLTAAGKAKTWYEIDKENKILAVYSSTPTDVTYRLTAPRFDSAEWTNARTSTTVGFVLNDPDNNQNTANTGLLKATTASGPELINQTGTIYSEEIAASSAFKLSINGVEVKEVSSFAESIVGNFRAGVATIITLAVDNLTIRTHLISPIADIDQLKTIDATISGTLYADNIKGKTIDKLTSQLNLLNEEYSTASAILADLQAKYTSYSTILDGINTATVSGDPLALSPLATMSATIPSGLALDSLNIRTIVADDIMANSSVFTKSISSFDTDLYIQPTADKAVHLLASLMTLYPNGKVVVAGDLLITGTIYANNIDTRTATVSGSLALGKGELATDSGKLMALFGNNGQVVGSVDASGSANFGQLTTDGLIIASGNANTNATSSAQANSNTTIGTAMIATGASELVIANNKVTDNTLIYITPISNTDNQVLYIKSKQSGSGFTVAVPSALPNQISFNYWLVQTK